MRPAFGDEFSHSTDWKFAVEGQLCSRLCWLVSTAVYAVSNIFNWEWYNPKKWEVEEVDVAIKWIFNPVTFPSLFPFLSLLSLLVIVRWSDYHWIQMQYVRVQWSDRSESRCSGNTITGHRLSLAGNCLRRSSPANFTLGWTGQRQNRGLLTLKHASQVSYSTNRPWPNLFDLATRLSVARAGGWRISTIGPCNSNFHFPVRARGMMVSVSPLRSHSNYHQGKSKIDKKKGEDLSWLQLKWSRGLSAATWTRCLDPSWI